MRIRFFLLVLLASTFLHRVSAESGRTALGILTRSFAARASGMGEALAGDAGELDSIAFNPGAMAKLTETQVSATYQRGLAEDSFGYLNWGQVFSFGTVFVAASYLDAGTIELNQSDGTTGTRRAQQDAAGTVGFSFGRKTSWSLGVAGKVFRSELAEVASASGFAADVGGFWQTPWKVLSFGAAMQNIGSDIQYERSDDELPTTSRVGLRLLSDQQQNHGWPDVFRNRYALYGDGVEQRRETTKGNAGLEISRKLGDDILLTAASFRAGYVGATKAPTVGAGFQIGLVTIDYGVNFVETFDLAHRVTMTFHFNENKKAEQMVPHHRKNVLHEEDIPR